MIRVWCWFMLVILLFDAGAMAFDWWRGAPASDFVWFWALLGCSSAIIMFIRELARASLALDGRE